MGYAAIRTLYKGRNALKDSYSDKELSGIIDFKSKAEANTASIDKNGAMVINGILGGETVDKMLKVYQDALSNISVNVTINNPNGTVTFKTKPQVAKENAIRTAGEKKMKNAALDNYYSNPSLIN